MIRSLFTGVTGLMNQQIRMDVIGNNVANVNTTGFKRGRVQFQDLFCQTLRQGMQAASTGGGLNPLQVGLGTQLAAIDTLMDQGAIQQTGRSTDLAIEGEGFFSVVSPDGSSFFTRDGNMSINPNFDLVSSNTGFKMLGWMATQNPLDGSVQLGSTGTVPEAINTALYLKKHAHQTSMIGYSSNLDSSSAERDIKLGTDLLAFRDTAGNMQQLQFKFKKLDTKNWLWSAIDESEGIVANGSFKVDEDGKILDTTVEPAGPNSNATTPYFVYDPDGAVIPAQAGIPLNAVTNTGDGSSSSVQASGNLIKNENIDIIFDGGDPDRATTFRVVGSDRGFIGGGTLGGTQAGFDGMPFQFESGWRPSKNVSFQLTSVQDLNAERLSTQENRATVNFTAGTNYSTADILSIINNALKSGGVDGNAQYDSVTKCFSISTNDTGSNRTLMMDRISGPLSELGFNAGISGGTEYLSNFSTNYGVEPITLASSVIFQVSDSNNNSVMIRLQGGQYTRSELQSTIQNLLNTNGVNAQASFVDSNNDTIPDRLRIAASAGSTLQITDIQGLLSQLGLNPMTLGENTHSSSLDLSLFKGGFTSSKDFGAEPITIGSEVRFRIEDQYLNGNDTDNVVVIPVGNYTRNSLQTLIQDELSRLNLPAQVMILDTDGDNVPNQLQLNGILGEQLRITDMSGSGSLQTQLGITPSNLWTPDRDISFEIVRPDFAPGDPNYAVTINLPRTHANAPFSSDSLQATIQSTIDAQFGPNEILVELIDKNGDGVRESLQLRAQDPGERFYLNNQANISLLGMTSGTAQTGTGGSAPQVFSNLDLSNDAWNPIGDVSFTISDANARTTSIVLPDLDNSGSQIVYTRSALLSYINTQLVKDNVDAVAQFADTNNDNTPDRLIITGTSTGSGQQVTLSGNASMAQLGLNPGTYRGTAATAIFNQGGLNFTLTEGLHAWKPNEQLSFSTTAEQGMSDSVRIDLPGVGKSKLEFSTQVNDTTFKIEGAVNLGAIHTTSITIYDSLGTSHELLTSWEHTDKATQEWRYMLSYSPNDPEIVSWAKDPANGVVDPNQPTDEELERANNALIPNRKGYLYFDTTGKIDLGKSTIHDISLSPSGANPLTIKLDKKLISQFDSAFTTKAKEQDGYGMGMLETIYFEQDGTIRGVYSNGQKQPIGQIALTSFNNPSGLEKIGKNLYEFSPNSGLAMVGRPGEGGRGVIAPGSLEMSNVDIAEEFTNMIITQRAFQATSRVITTADEILQEVVNIKR